MNIARTKLPPGPVATSGLALLLLIVPPILPRSRATSPRDRPPMPQHIANNVVTSFSSDAPRLDLARETTQNTDSPSTPVTAGDSAVHPGARTITMIVTAYCPCRKCCGRHADGRTASGKPVTFNHGWFVAADTRILPFFTRVKVPGYHGGATVPVLDRGRDIRGNRLDVFFASHERARRWGSRRITIQVLP